MRWQSVIIALLLSACAPSNDSTDTESDTQATDTAEDIDSTPSLPDGTDITSNPNNALVLPEAWVATKPEQDPFADGTAPIHCPKAAYGEENGYFEVETDKCNYLTVEQPAQLTVTAGQKIHIVLWHLTLGGTGAAEANVGIQLGPTTVWEKTISLPSPAKVYQESVMVESAVATGDPVYFHVKNHGTNSWRLLSIELD